MVIDPSRPTLASALKQAGYATGVIGKWHLGLGRGTVDWNKEITPGPPEVGFDYSFLIPATGDRVPCLFVESGRVANLDPHDPIHVIINGISRIGYMCFIEENKAKGSSCTSQRTTSMCPARHLRALSVGRRWARAATPWRNSTRPSEKCARHWISTGSGATR